MNFEKVLMGITKYLNREIYSEMNDWQEVLARMAVSRVIGNAESLKKTLIENPFIKTFSIMDDEGNVDVEGVARDLKKQIADKGKLTITIPLFGVFTFVSEDVDKLHRTIMEG
jgi:hypothetical protein